MRVNRIYIAAEPRSVEMAEIQPDCAESRHGCITIPKIMILGIVTYLQYGLTLPDRCSSYLPSLYPPFSAGSSICLPFFIQFFLIYGDAVIKYPSIITDSIGLSLLQISAASMILQISGTTNGSTHRLTTFMISVPLL